MTGGAPRIAWILESDPPDAFPALEEAFAEPDGLLAAGGNLSVERLLYAYRHGIFPWYDEGQPVLWWSPDPRCVLKPAHFHVARRLRRQLRSSGFTVTFNTAFDEVIGICAEPREGQSGTWITSDMNLAYRSLHRQGWAHSIEVRGHDRLVGGLYGIAIGKVFFGESMFSHETGASKAAMLALCKELTADEFELLDCQVVSPHLLSLGATLMPRAEFARLLDRACVANTQLSPFAGQPRPITDYL